MKINDTFERTETQFKTTDKRQSVRKNNIQSLLHNSFVISDFINTKLGSLPILGCVKIKESPMIIHPTELD